MDEIKTDVDRLIEILQTRGGKPVRMGELVRLSGLSASQARKWIHILEERGQVRLRYSFSDEEVEWRGAPALTPRPDLVRAGDVSSFSPGRNGLPKGNTNPHLEAARFQEERYRTQTPAQGGDGQPDDGLDTNEPEGMAPAPNPNRADSQEPAQESAHNAQAPSDETPQPASAARVFPKPGSAVLQPRVEEPPEPVLPPLPQMNEPAMRVSGKLKGKIAAVRAKMEEIEKLKAEKKRLLVEVYRPMETKLESEAGVITEKLIELEHQLLGIREQAARVPGEVAELAGEQERIVQIAAEMRRLYAETDRQMTQSVQTLAQARNGARERMEQARAAVSAQEGALGRMEQMLAGMTEQQRETAERLAQAREALSAQEAQIRQSEENLRAAQDAQAGMQAQVQAAHGEIERQREALGEMDRQLERMDEVQAWVEAHQAEYNQRMGRLSEYMQNAGNEYHKLKAAIDSGFIHRYLRDLRALSESYEFELSQAERLEASVDARLEETKKELAALIAQAKEVADTQEMRMSQAAPAPIDNLDEVQGGQAQAVQDVLAHQTDRRKLRELIRHTMSGEDEGSEDGAPGNEPDVDDEPARSQPLDLPMEPEMPAPQDDSGGRAAQRRRGRPRKGERKK